MRSGARFWRHRKAPRMCQPKLESPMTKVSVIDFDAKDYERVPCPQCNGYGFAIYRVSKKDTNHPSHTHVRCVLCDTTWCLKESHSQDVPA
jgi:hypothetical protein